MKLTLKNEVCPYCDGSGLIDTKKVQEDPRNGVHHVVYEDCSTCEGSGIVTIATKTEILPYKQFRHKDLVIEKQ